MNGVGIPGGAWSACGGLNRRNVRPRDNPWQMNMTEYPEAYAFSARHVWALLDKKKTHAKIGVTDYLLDNVGQIDYMELPTVGDELEADSFCIALHVSSGIKHLRCPLTGRVTAVNQDILDDPSPLFSDYQNNWLFEMEVDDLSECDQLMSGSQYGKYLDSL